MALRHREGLRPEDGHAADDADRLRYCRSESQRDADQGRALGRRETVLAEAANPSPPPNPKAGVHAERSDTAHSISQLLRAAVSDTGYARLDENPYLARGLAVFAILSAAALFIFLRSAQTFAADPLEISSVVSTRRRRYGQLIDLISNIKVGDTEARCKDVLGRVYEYSLSQFASAEGKKGLAGPNWNIALGASRNTPAQTWK
jgi:hypothetical protein